MARCRAEADSKWWESASTARRSRDVFDLLLGWAATEVELNVVRARRFSPETVTSAKGILAARLRVRFAHAYPASARTNLQKVQAYMAAIATSNDVAEHIVGGAPMPAAFEKYMADWRRDLILILGQVCTRGLPNEACAACVTSPARDATIGAACSSCQAPSILVSACILDGIIHAGVPLCERIPWGRRRTIGIQDGYNVSLAELAMVCDWCAWWPRLLLCWNALDWTDPTCHNILYWSMFDPKFGLADEALSARQTLGTDLYPVGAGFLPDVGMRIYSGMSPRHMQVMEHGREFAARCIDQGLRMNPLRHLVLQWAIGYEHDVTRLNPFCALMNALLTRLASVPDDELNSSFSLEEEIDAERILTALIQTGSHDGDGLLDLTSPHPHHYDGTSSPHPHHYDGMSGQFTDKIPTLTDRLASMHDNLHCWELYTDTARSAQRISRVHEIALDRREIIRHFRRSLLPRLLTLHFLPAREMIPAIAAYAMSPISNPALLDTTLSSIRITNNHSAN
jgi:hypothetical protein